MIFRHLSVILILQQYRFVTSFQAQRLAHNPRITRTRSNESKSIQHSLFDDNSQVSSSSGFSDDDEEKNKQIESAKNAELFLSQLHALENVDEVFAEAEEALLEASAAMASIESIDSSNIKPESSQEFETRIDSMPHTDNGYMPEDKKEYPRYPLSPEDNHMELDLNNIPEQQTVDGLVETAVGGITIGLLAGYVIYITHDVDLDPAQPMLGLGTIFGIMSVQLARSKQFGGGVIRNVGGPVKDVKQAIQEIPGKAAVAAKEVVTQKVEIMKERVLDIPSNVMNLTMEKISSVTNRIDSVKDELTENVSSVAHNVKEVPSKLTNSVNEIVSDTTNQIKDTMKNISHNIKDDNELDKRKDIENALTPGEKSPLNAIQENEAGVDKLRKGITQNDSSNSLLENLSNRSDFKPLKFSLPKVNIPTFNLQKHTREAEESGNKDDVSMNHNIADEVKDENNGFSLSKLEIPSLTFKKNKDNVETNDDIADLDFPPGFFDPVADEEEVNGNKGDDLKWMMEKIKENRNNVDAMSNRRREIVDADIRAHRMAKKKSQLDTERSVKRKDTITKALAEKAKKMVEEKKIAAKKRDDEIAAEKMATEKRKKEEIARKKKILEDSQKTDVMSSQTFTIRKRAKKVSAAPKGVPTISSWRRLKNGSVTGFVSGSPNYDDGTRITTTVILTTVEGGAVVETVSGSRYFLESIDKMHKSRTTMLELFPTFTNKDDNESKGEKAHEAEEKKPYSSPSINFEAIRAAAERATSPSLNLASSFLEKSSKESPTTEGKHKKSKTNHIASSIKLTSAPAGVPKLKNWRRNRDGSVTGHVYGSNIYDDETKITTSPISTDCTGGTVVKTDSGSKYYLEE